METATLIGIITILILSVCTHEACHAFVADRLGDPTARMLGRVTLNPIPHIDLFMTIILPGMLIMSGSPILFGGAKPVPVDVRRFRQPRRDFMLVGLAGPASNFAIAFLLAGLLSLLLHTGIFIPESNGTKILQYGVLINLLLAIFNLIPIPPLDGSRALLYVLPRQLVSSYMQLERYGILILFGMLFVFRDGFSWMIESVLYPAAGLLGTLFQIPGIL